MLVVSFTEITKVDWSEIGYSHLTHEWICSETTLNTRTVIVVQKELFIWNFLNQDLFYILSDSYFYIWESKMIQRSMFDEVNICKFWLAVIKFSQKSHTVVLLQNRNAFR